MHPIGHPAHSAHASSTTVLLLAPHSDRRIRGSKSQNPARGFNVAPPDEISDGASHFVTYLASSIRDAPGHAGRRHQRAAERFGSEETSRRHSHDVDQLASVHR
jgi:hypothetical protein